MFEHVNPFMQAHGATPGPGMRPLQTGMISGLIAMIFAVGLLIVTGAQQELTTRLGFEALLFSEILYDLFTGWIYGNTFQRAANDRRGGWLLGASSGFFFWMFGPAFIFLRLLGRPLLIGTPAVGLLGAQVVHGLFLGLMFPWVHRWVTSSRPTNSTSAREMQQRPLMKPAFEGRKKSMSRI